MFAGYSVLCMASACDADARIITCDTDPKAEKIARKYFAASEYGHKIEIKMGPALETISHLQEQNPNLENILLTLKDGVNVVKKISSIIPI
jgi:predicted O-methyltransferase YrrM